jgi:hypothetical protein
MTELRCFGQVCNLADFGFTVFSRGGQSGFVAARNDFAVAVAMKSLHGAAMGSAH